MASRLLYSWPLAFIVAIAATMVLAVDVAPPGPISSDYSESGGVQFVGGKNGPFGPGTSRQAGAQCSKVSILVGEGSFNYIANGVTTTPYRIAVSGNYYNNDINRTGYVRIFLVAEPAIYRWWVQPQPLGVLDVVIRNNDGVSLGGPGKPFYYEILSPYPVNSYNDLKVSQYNATALIVEGPSRGYYFPAG